MAEPLSWLKLAPRSRTPSTLSPADSLGRNTSRDPPPSDLRRPGSSRMSNHGSLPEAALGLSPLEDNAGLVIRNQDQVWYNPSLDQMVEALQVRLMTYGALEPVPVEYNSYLLHLVEGFAGAREKVRKTEAAYQEVKRSLGQSLEQLRQVANDWLERESQYRAEVKRLEILLSKSSPDGLATVALARTNSIVDRGASERGSLLSRLSGFKKQQVNGSGSSPSVSMSNRTFQREAQVNFTGNGDRTGERSSHERAPTPKILDAENDFFISEKFRRQDAITNASRSRRAYRRREVLLPRLGDFKGGRDDVRNPFVTGPPTSVITDEPYHTYPRATPSAEIHVNNNVSVDLASPKTTRRPEGIRRLATTSFPLCANSAGYTDGGAFHNTVSLHEHNHSRFSFEPGDDVDPLPDCPMEELEALDSRYYEQPPTQPEHRSLESLSTKRRQHDSGAVNCLVAHSIPSRAPRPSIQGSAPAMHHGPGSLRVTVQSPLSRPIRAHQDSCCGGQTMAGGSPTRCSRDLDGPSATSVAGRETTQRPQAEMDARIAATLALANIQGNICQK